MNLSYRLVWSNVRNAWIAVSELAKSHAKSGAAMVVVAAATAAMPAQAFVVDDSYDLNATDEVISVGVDDDFPLVQFKAGQTFTFGSESGLLVAFGSGNKIEEEDSGGGTYNLTKIASQFVDWNGIDAYNGGTIDLSNAAAINYIASTGERPAISAELNTVIKLGNLTMTHTGTPATGGLDRFGKPLPSFNPKAIIALENSQITLDNLNLTTNVDGLYVDGDGSQITINKGEINVTSDAMRSFGSRAVEVAAGGKISLNEVEMTVEGAESRGFYVYDKGVASVSGGVTNMEGTRSQGFVVEDAHIDLTNTTVNSKGSSSEAIYLTKGATANLNGTTINTLAQNTYGLFIVGGGASLTNSDLVVSGINSTGFYSYDGLNSTITGGAILVDAEASNSNAVVNLLTTTDALIKLDGVNVTAPNATSDGLLLTNRNANITNHASNQFELINTTVTAGRNALALDKGFGTMSVVGGSLSGVNAISASNASDLLVTTNDTLLTGNVVATSGSFVDLKMVGSDVTKSVLTGAIINARNVNIDPSTWNITANSDMVNLTNDASDFRFVNADGSVPDANYTDFKTVTVDNYTGVNGSNVYMNTRLNSDDVTGTNNDKIVVRDGGSMSGDTTFHINNVGGVGAPTTDGILFADAQGSATIDKTNFKLAGGSVTAGAYGYVARQGQASNLTDNSQDLFLISYIPQYATVDANGFVVDGVPPAEENNSNGNVPPAEENNSSGNTSTISYSADFVTYNAIADVVSLSASTLLGTYHERMGAQNTALIQAENASTFNTNSWGRLVADTREVAYDNAALNQSIKGTTAGFQVGHSIWQGKNANNTTSQAGVAIGYVKGSMDVSGDFITTKNGQAGTVDADTTALMGYYTLAGNDGFYVDAVLQYSFSSAEAQGAQSSLSLDSTGLRGSVEVGMPFRFDSVTVEPQGQIVAYKDSFDDAVDSKGYAMSQDDSSGVALRLGARITSNDTTAAFKPWFAANLNLQNASTGTGVMDNTNNVGLDSDKDAIWADMSVGMTYQTSSDISVYGHLKQSVAIGGGTNTTTSGSIGVQKTW